MHAAVWGMERFSHYLKGWRFILFTDHKPLEKLGKVHTRTLHRIQEAMLECDFEIQYKKGSEMPADYLSRNISSINLPIEAPDVMHTKYHHFISKRKRAIAVGRFGLFY